MPLVPFGLSGRRKRKAYVCLASNIVRVYLRHPIIMIISPKTTNLGKE